MRDGGEETGTGDGERVNTQTGRGGWGGGSEGTTQLWIIQNELKGGRDRRRGEIGSGSH